MARGLSDAFIKWCRASTSSAIFLDRVDRFSAAGISLNHPPDGAVALLDVDGDEVATTTAELASLIDRRIGTTLTFEWWFLADTDLTCAYRFVPGKREIQTFYLDGLSATEVSTICGLVRDLFWDEAHADDWLIFDTAGRSADFDWDDYLQYGAGDPAEVPDLIVVGSGTLEARPKLPRPPAPSLSNSEFVEITRADWVLR